MTVTIHEVLGELRATSLDERDKGDKFERLVQAYLKTDPEWTARFSDVWLWTEWPGRAGVNDIGIDLVAKLRDADSYAAIQCKFYGSGQRVAKADIDSFMALSMRPDFGFSQRYVFDTSAGWTHNVEEQVKGVVQRVDVGYLDDAAIDWSQFRWETPEVVVPTGKKSLRPHQSRALEDVFKGLRTYDRGKLIMACGTGKTFTSLRIAEELVGSGGTVLFLVPSIQLLSQSLREWMANAEVDIRPFAVCSDVRVGRRAQTDDADMSTIDLTQPATTDPAKLLEQMSVGRHARERMTVVFSTYQSIDVLIEAQSRGLGEFDLVVCDEAHRTTGVTLAGEDESAFVKVHDDDRLRARKRLYMTATPRVFGDDVRRKATDADAVLADMGDEDTFGPELHRLGFGEAVEADLLTDYKVLVLAVDETYVAENFQRAIAESGEIRLDEAAKLIGCWNGLAKNFGSSAVEHGSSAVEPMVVEEAEERGRLETTPMRTAVAFAQHIKASKTAAQAFPTMVDRAIIDLPEGRTPLRVEARHVDGTMGIHERNTHLAWLKEPPAGDVCRILTNAKCLSEGVDVPALDAVLFLTPRGSQVDVVQSVGRVMRKAPGKELGYIILPVVVPSGVAPEDALRDNERYKVVWQVLQALRSHDDRFHALVNKIELNKQRPTDKLEVFTVTNPTDTDADGSSTPDAERKRQESVQTILEFPTDQFRDAMYAKIVQKVGERRYWETWAKDVADIAGAHVTRINGLIADPESNPAREFEEFLKGLRGNLNENVTRAEAVDMLAQHLVTRPIFEALFDGYDFAASNPVARTMELMLASLDEYALPSENERLEGFYDSVRRRVAGVDNAEGKQRILVELYDKFFSVAFKKTVDRLGIVYTPIEIVDFILRSADAVLRKEFGQGLTDEGVHILDGFTGTGTFLVRLLQSGLIEPHDLARKYATELHGNEILLLAYYIACVNIEQTYADLAGRQEPFPGLILTDTFQSWEPDDKPDLDVFPENNARLERLKNLPITVIVGNPPYSSGQDSANDDNANEKYPALDAEIRRTYADTSSATNKNSLYDSYIRAIKWASLRIQDRGVIAYVTNGGFLDSNTADGMRMALAEEFTSIHVYNLRGNQRTAGEQSRKEGGKVFGGGSRATVAITVLVKNPAAVEPVETPSVEPGSSAVEHPSSVELVETPGVSPVVEERGTSVSKPPATIHYTDVGDYLTREDKLAQVAEHGDVLALPSVAITPNEHGDWLNQRREDFDSFLPLLGPEAIAGHWRTGPQSNRDPWVYNKGTRRLRAAMTRASRTYETALRGDVSSDTKDIKWSSALQDRLHRREALPLSEALPVTMMYRPFEKTFAWADRRWFHRAGGIWDAFPDRSTSNLGFFVPAVGSMSPPFVALMTDVPTDSGAAGIGAVYYIARHWYLSEDSLPLPDSRVVDGYRRIDNITDEALGRFRAAYGVSTSSTAEEPSSTAITKDDIFYYVYGLLHSPAYRETYAADLKKSLPRIPFVRDFWGFADAGRRLSELHLGYESVEPYPLDGLDAGLDRIDEPGFDPYAFYAVGDKKMRFGKPSPEQKAAGERADRSVIHYNDRITLRGIPAEAYRYLLGSRSAVEWIIDRYYVKTDKASGIVNDPNDWSREVGDPRYILDLLARIVTVSLETMRVVDALPPLEILDPT